MKAINADVMSADMIAPQHMLRKTCSAALRSTQLPTALVSW